VGSEMCIRDRAFTAVAVPAPLALPGPTGQFDVIAAGGE